MVIVFKFTTPKLFYIPPNQGVSTWWQRFSLAREWRENKNLWRYRVKILLSMTQYNFRTRLEPNLFSGHFNKVGTVLASRYAHSSCARMTRGAKTGYTTSLTSVTSPNSWTTYCAYSTGFWHDFFRGFSFLSIFRVPEKTSFIRVGGIQCRLSLVL